MKLRSLSLGDTELINRIYVAVRDRNWDTAPPVISDLRVDEGEDAFLVTFDVICTLREIEFPLERLISGDAAGTITFSMDGEARVDIPAESNRLLHPAS